MRAALNDLDDAALNAVDDTVALVNATAPIAGKITTKYLAGLRIVDTNKSPDKVTFAITIKHTEGVTYTATCVFNYNNKNVWTVTVAKK